MKHALVTEKIFHYQLPSSQYFPLEKRSFNLGPALQTPSLPGFSEMSLIQSQQELW